jgi:hypothetical protein
LSIFNSIPEKQGHHFNEKSRIWIIILFTASCDHNRIISKTKWSMQWLLAELFGPGHFVGLGLGLLLSILLFKKYLIIFLICEQFKIIINIS